MFLLLPALQAVSHEDRLRILYLLSMGDLTVGELVIIMGQSQPRVSRNLKILQDARLLHQTREGSHIYYRNNRKDAEHFLKFILENINQDEEPYANDNVHLQTLFKENAQKAQDFFQENATKWQDIRQSHMDNDWIDGELLKHVENQKPKNFLDIGTGSGHGLLLLGNHMKNGLGIDLSRAMLKVARSRINQAKMPHIQVCEGNMNNLDFEPNQFDGILLHMSLHYTRKPLQVLKKIHQILCESGKLYIVDFLPHAHASLRDDQGHHWLGFDRDAVFTWLNRAGFSYTSCDESLKHPHFLPTALWIAKK